MGTVGLVAGLGILLMTTAGVGARGAHVGGGPGGGSGLLLTPDVVFENFDNGTLGALTDGGILDIVDDPAGGPGKCVRQRFTILDSEVGHISRDRYVQFRANLAAPPGNTLEHFFIVGRLRFGAPTNNSSIGRKLIYLKGDRATNGDWQIGFNSSNPSTGGNLLQFHIQCTPWGIPLTNIDVAPQFIMAINTWYGAELEVQLNTVGNSDGYIRLWLYTADWHTELHRQYLPNLNIRGSSTRKLEDVPWGEQLTRQAAPQDTQDEYRYWDDCGVSTFKCVQPVVVPGVGSNISLGNSSSSIYRGRGLAPTQADIAAATSLAYKIRIRGNKLIGSTGGVCDLLQVYESGVARKLDLMVGQSGGGIRLALLTGDGWGNRYSATYPVASLDRNAYYHIYVHYDAANAGDQQAMQLYTDDGEDLLIDTSTANSSFSLDTSPNRGAVALNVFAQGSTNNLNGATFDRVAIHSGALTDTLRWSKPASGDSKILSAWDFEEGSGNSAANVVPGGQAMVLSGNWNWL